MTLRLSNNDTIVAIATSETNGGALGIVRLSGKNTFKVAEKVFKGKKLSQQASHTIHFGTIWDGDECIDEVLASVFIEPTSYTKENMIEFSCHGSIYILQKIVKTLIKNGARLAKRGEFTQKAFLNGRFDLTQAEAVSDLIQAENKALHKIALQQMRGEFSNELKKLRAQLVHFSSLINLELDFSEEDVEFVDRKELKKILHKVQHAVLALLENFDKENVIKKGVPVVIAGKPNVGKSTLLNLLLNDEKAIVSDIAGTTRDTIEDTIHIDDILFRFIDTAGLRESTNKIERIGVERSKKRIKEAFIVLYLLAPNRVSVTKIIETAKKLQKEKAKNLVVVNKADMLTDSQVKELSKHHILAISALKRKNVEKLKQKIVQQCGIKEKLNASTLTLVNIRHYECLLKVKESLENTLENLNRRLTNDFIAFELNQALHYLGEITGEITAEDILDNIFSKFCIGK